MFLQKLTTLAIICSILTNKLWYFFVIAYCYACNENKFCSGLLSFENNEKFLLCLVGKTDQFQIDIFMYKLHH